MTTLNPYPTRRGGLTPKKMLLFVGGALAGAATGTGLMLAIKHFGVVVKMLTGFDLLSMTIAAFFMALGIVQGGIAMNRRQLGKLLEGDGETPVDDVGRNLPATDSEVRVAFLQAGVLFLAGFLLLVPIAALGRIESQPAVADWVFAGIFLLFLVQTWWNVQLWRICDEVVRGMILSTCALTFAISQGALFLWAAAERLHLVSVIPSWHVYSLLMCCYIVVNSWIALRMRR